MTEPRKMMTAELLGLRAWASPRAPQKSPHVKSPKLLTLDLS